jgi:hypothetical protein
VPTHWKYESYLFVVDNGELFCGDPESAGIGKEIRYKRAEPGALASYLGKVPFWILREIAEAAGIPSWRPSRPNEWWWSDEYGEFRCSLAEDGVHVIYEGGTNERGMREMGLLAGLRELTVAELEGHVPTWVFNEIRVALRA